MYDDVVAKWKINSKVPIDALYEKIEQLEARIKVIEEENISTTNELYRLENSLDARIDILVDHYKNEHQITTKQKKMKDKIVKWVLPVEVDKLTQDLFVTFPDDLLEAANLKEYDQVEWVDNGDGSWIIRKFN
jgi:ribosome assembly protein YihI (activator of Der GTPase)